MFGSSKKTIVASALDTSLVVISAQNRAARLPPFSLLSSPTTGHRFVQTEKVHDSQAAFEAHVADIRHQMSLKSADLFVPVDYSATCQGSLCGQFFRVLTYFPAFASDLASHQQQTAKLRSSDFFSCHNADGQRYLLQLLVQLLSGLAELEKAGLGLVEVSPANVVVERAGAFKLVAPTRSSQKPGTVPRAVVEAFVRKEPIYLSETAYKLIGKPLPSTFDVSKSNLFSLGLLVLEAGLNRSIQKVYGAKFTFDTKALKTAQTEFRGRYGENALLVGLLERMLRIEDSARETVPAFLAFFASLAPSPSATPKSQPKSRQKADSLPVSQGLEVQRSQPTERAAEAENLRFTFATEEKESGKSRQAVSGPQPPIRRVVECYADSPSKLPTPSFDRPLEPPKDARPAVSVFEVPKKAALPHSRPSLAFPVQQGLGQSDAEPLRVRFRTMGSQQRALEIFKSERPTGKTQLIGGTVFSEIEQLYEVVQPDGSRLPMRVLNYSAGGAKALSANWSVNLSAVDQRPFNGNLSTRSDAPSLMGRSQPTAVRGSTQVIKRQG